MKKRYFMTIVVGLAPTCHARLFTVVNSCPFTIWLALFTDPNVGPNKPDQPTGWEQPANTTVSFGVPDDWKAGRIWGRRNCDFSVNPGPLSCQTGGCNGGLLCDPITGTGVPPTSLAEWTLQGDGNRDFYDVSLVDGYDLPMRITNNRGCPVADCPVDLGPNCPAELRGPFDSTGFPIGCKSACAANIDGNAANSPNCCSGQFDTPATCPPTGVAFYSYFKGNCPNAYAYAFDESSNTALWTCDSGLAADYTLTFCPSLDPNAPPPANISSMNVTSSPSQAPSSVQNPGGSPSSTSGSGGASEPSVSVTFISAATSTGVDWRIYALTLLMGSILSRA